jgi:predicted AAA+ superfamily ATPase
LSTKQLEKSVLHLDWEEQIQIMFDKAPRRLLLGDTPRLIDEWQVIPKLWDHLRHEIQLHWLIIPYWKKIIASTKTGGVSRPTIYDYLDTLNRLMILEDQPAWSTHIRSSYSLRTAPKRHFTDVSMAVAALATNQTTFL